MRRYFSYLLDHLAHALQDNLAPLPPEEKDIRGFFIKIIIIIITIIDEIITVAILATKTFVKLCGQIHYYILKGSSPYFIIQYRVER